MSTMSSMVQCDGRMIVPVNSVVPRNMEKRGERRFHWQAALLLEEVRRRTYADWPVNYIDPDELARAGFFYLRTEDHVQCVFCQGIVGYWEKGDQPVLEHKKHFPNCPYMNGSATGNIPRRGNSNIENEVCEFLSQYHNFKISTTKPQPPSTTYQIDSSRLSDGGQLAYPQLNTLQNRLATYTRWPKDVGVEPDVLAEAGFASTQLADWVQCFHCGGGLYGWRKGDNPIIDHARFFPYCPFVRSNLDEDSIRKILKEDPPPFSQLRKISLSNEEAELLLHHPIGKRLLSMGLPKVSVREALRSYLERRGILCRTVTEALELVFDYDEKQRQNSRDSLTHDGPLAPEEALMPVHLSTPEIATSSKNAICNGRADQENNNSNYISTLKEVETLNKQVMLEEKKLLCRMCQKAKIAVVFQPCSHLHFCTECARPRDSCPTCGAIIRGTLKPIIG